MSEQDHMCDIKEFPAYKTKHWSELALLHMCQFCSLRVCLQTSTILCFAQKYTIFHLILKIFTDCLEQEFKHPHVKYLSSQMILQFLHKLSYN